MHLHVMNAINELIMNNWTELAFFLPMNICIPHDPWRENKQPTKDGTSISYLRTQINLSHPYIH